MVRTKEYKRGEWKKRYTDLHVVRSFSSNLSFLDKTPIMKQPLRSQFVSAVSTRFCAATVDSCSTADDDAATERSNLLPFESLCNRSQNIIEGQASEKSSHTGSKYRDPRRPVKSRMDGESIESYSSNFSLIQF